MNVTEAVVLPEEILAVPIVGAPGLRGHVLAPTACNIDWRVHAPVAVLVDVVGAVAEMTPPL